MLLPIGNVRARGAGPRGLFAWFGPEDRTLFVLVDPDAGKQRSIVLEALVEPTIDGARLALDVDGVEIGAIERLERGRWRRLEAELPPSDHPLVMLAVSVTPPVGTTAERRRAFSLRPAVIAPGSSGAP
jgi:hypothetical protein